MTKNQLTRVQMIQLANFIIGHYTASKLHDGEFSAKATVELGFTVTEANVAALRRDLKIPSLREVLRTKEDATIAERLARVERFLGRLEPNWKEQT